MPNDHKGTAESDQHEYVAIPWQHGRTIHRRSCSYLTRTKAPKPWAITEIQAGDRACARCLPDGVYANERTRLMQPWAERYFSLLGEVAEHCRDLSDEDLEALRLAASGNTTSNCWWAVYYVAPLVGEAVYRELHDREQAASEITTPPGQPDGETTT